ncbi:MAG: hypothetical protein LUG57_09140 [Oscillospiraceae bacterium]|nr:hypothetical protein [Oscillospiraceae bacterium]
MKTYTIVGGVNGTGKSSLTGSLKAQTRDLGAIIDIDKITAEAGASPLAGGRLALGRIWSCLERGVCFTQESTLSGHFVAKTAREAVERGYYVRLYYVGLDSVEESVSRIANRVARGGHDIDADIVRRRFAARWPSLAAVLPYCNEALFFDNDNGFVEVAEYRNGELLPKGDRRPQWLRELAAYLKEHPPIG